MITNKESAPAKPTRTTVTRKDIVIIVIQYEHDCTDDVLEIHEAVEAQYEGVVSVRAVFGRTSPSGQGGLGAGLGSAPRRYEAPISQHQTG